MKTNILVQGLTATMSILLIATAFSPKASAIDYSTKAINAYDHNGKLINTQIASDVQYIEVEDLNLEPETYSITGIDGKVVDFTMIPVIGTNSYKQRSVMINWPEADKYSTVKTFYIGQTEVTNGLWKAVMGSVPSKKNTGDDFPVEAMTWDDICTVGGFLDRLNKMAQQDPDIRELMNGREFCLPNEWEWEYAANGGNFNERFYYSGSGNAEDVAWYEANSGSTTHEVAQKKPNGLGIYDMSGNVWEYCAEYCLRNNDGTYNISNRPRRGGGWMTPIEDMNFIIRWGGYAATVPNAAMGFRLALKEKELHPQTFSVTGEDGAVVRFNMMPVYAKGNYKLRSSVINWPDEDKEAPLRTYYIGQTEVTNALWKAVMGSVPSANNTDDNFPVESVSWNDICKSGGFLDKLNEKLQSDPVMQELLDGRKFYLPTEWEWEYAAGGGIATTKFKYSGSNTADDVAWYEPNSDGTTHEVAKKQPNALGLFDMSGNVWEHCSENQYRNNDGTYIADNRPRRGGGLITPEANMNYVFRVQNTPMTQRNSAIGLRLVLK